MRSLGRFVILLAIVAFPCFGWTQPASKVAFDPYQKAHILYWDVNNTQWDSTYRVSQAFDVNARILSRHVDQYQAGWIPSTKDEYEYTSPNDSIIIRSAQWNGNAWIPTYLEANVFDTADVQVYQVFANWNMTAWDTVAGVSLTYTRDAQNRIDTVTGMEYRMTPVPGWYLGFRAAYSYGINTEPESVNFFAWVGNAWEPVSRWTDLAWHYFPRFKTRSYTAENWNGVGFDYDQQMNCEYGPNGAKRCSLNVWNVSSWEPDYRQGHQWDNDGHYTETKTELFDNGNWVLGAHSVFSHSYTGSALTQTIETVWVESQSSFENYRKTVYSDFAVAAPKPFETLPARCFPNPVADALHIEVPDMKPSLRVKVYSLSGKEQLSWDGSPNVAFRDGISTATLNSGIYILELKQGNKVLHEKLLKQ